MRPALPLLLCGALLLAVPGCKQDPSTPEHWERALNRAGGASARVRLVEQLRESGHADPAFLATLHRWLKEERHDRVRTAMVRLIAEIGDPSSLEPLNAAIRADDPNADGKLLNRQIAKAVGTLGDPAGVPIALRLLSTRDPYVRIAAIEALAALRVPSSAIALEDLAENLDVDPFLSHKAVEALGEIGASSSLPVLIRMMFHERAGAHFYPVSAFALYRYGPGATEALLPLFRGEDVELTAWARQAGIAEAGVYARTAQLLGDLQAQEAEPLLLDRLTYESSNAELQQIVRTVSAQALGRMGSRSAAPAIAAQLSSAEPHVQEQLILALIRIGGTDALPALRQTATSRSWSVREQSARALALLGGTGELPVLEAMLASEEKHTRTACAASPELPGCPDPAALAQERRAILMRHRATLAAGSEVQDVAGWRARLSAPEPGLRERAAVELGSARNVDAVAALLPLTADPDLEVRHAALHALDLLTEVPEARRTAREALPSWRRQLDEELGQARLGPMLEDLRRLIVKVER
ncbi:MAG TPA: HEAT repeat domain-containing protein [Myxococcaceae bacterium]|nr:HEAT repeat domain-containing protein [Myxococcaceae bacterium]